MRKSFTFVTVALFLLVLSSCDIQRRTYNRGFSIPFHTSKSGLHQARKPQSQIKLHKQGISAQSIKAELEAQKISDFALPIVQVDIAVPSARANSQDSCDKIILKNGKVIAAQIVELGDDKIKYLSCEETETPSYSISTMRVNYIEYANGSREYFYSTKPSQEFPIMEDETLPNVVPRDLASKGEVSVDVIAFSVLVILIFCVFFFVL